MRRGVRVFAAIALTAVDRRERVRARRSRPPPPPPPAAARRSAADHADAAAAAAARRAARSRAAPLTEDEIFARKSLEDAERARSRSADVFFALDSAQVGDDARPILQKDADWMKRWTSTKVMVEGTATRAAPRNTTSPSASAAPPPSATTWSIWASPPSAITDRQQGQGSAVLHRGERSLLAAEPPRSFRDTAK